MSYRWLTLIPFYLCCGLPSVALAQTVTFVRTVNDVPPNSAVNNELLQLNIEDLVEGERDETVVRLGWSVAGLSPGTWDYRLTYGAITETSTAPPLLRVQDTQAFAEAEGDQPLAGTLQVEVLLTDLIAAAEDLPPELGGSGRDDYDESICVNVFPDGNPDFNQTFSECWTFEVDTLAPSPPTITEIIPGEERIQVTWELLGDTRIEFYEAVYCTDTSTDVVSFETLPCPESEWFVVDRISDTVDTISLEDGISVGSRVVVAMRSVDEFENVGEPGDVEDATAQAVDDFFELYEGGEEGGFCFIATAAYGSYAHPLVRVLRAFRDRVLNPTPVGAALVWAYYHYAPPLARQVAGDPTLAGWVRWWLLPMAAIALIVMLSPLAALAWILRRGLRSVGRRGAGVAATVVLMAAIGASAPAYASRPDSDLTTVGIGLEFKGGPYSGEIQNETGFSDVFDDESRPLFTLGLDLQVFRGFGTVTVGGTVGFLQYTGKALFAKDAETDGGAVSSDTNVFNLVPMTLVVGYRFDYLADLTWIPLVPYAKGGLAYYIWWATDGVGNLQRQTNDDGDRLTARGGTFGVTGTLGLAFMLNKIEPRVAQSLFANTGIRGTYVFVEMTGSNVDDFGGDGFDLSDFNWSIGLYMEL